MLLPGIPGIVVDALCEGRVREAIAIAKQDPRIVFDPPPRSTLIVVWSTDGKLMAHSIGLPFVHRPTEQSGTAYKWEAYAENGTLLASGGINETIRSCKDVDRLTMNFGYLGPELSKLLGVNDSP